MYRSLNRLILQRVTLVALAMSVVVGTLVYLVEVRQVDNYVLDLTLKESHLLSSKIAEPLAKNDMETIAELDSLAEQLVQQHFVVAEVYDPNAAHLIGAVRFGNQYIEEELSHRHHQFPLDRHMHHENFYIQGDLFMQVLVPLFAPDDSLAGYFEGVYRVDETTLMQIKERVYRSVGLAVAVIIATVMIFYPIMLALNKEMIRFSDDLMVANIELMEVLGGAIAIRDRNTNSHNFRVTLYSIHLGEAVNLDSKRMRDLIAGAFLHDVGKIGIDDRILKKPGALDEDESRLMRDHVILGLSIIDKAHWLEGARDVIQYHHERFDGSGYAAGLKGDDIPLNARIFAIVDVFDALTSERPYKHAIDFDQALAMVNKGSGTLYDPKLIAAFNKIAKPMFEQISGLDDQGLERLLSGSVRRYFFTPHL